MSLDRRIDSLKKEHRELDVKIAQMENFKAINSEDLTALKRQKLYIKDEITRLQTVKA